MAFSSHTNLTLWGAMDAGIGDADFLDEAVCADPIRFGRG
jgi:hypothetical protein